MFLAAIRDSKQETIFNIFHEYPIKFAFGSKSQIKGDGVVIAFFYV
jgi:hypothetical protein